MGFWGIEVKPGKPYTYHSDDVEGRVYVTQATLGHGSSTEKCILQCSANNKSPVYLCSLLPDKIECCPLDLEFEEDDNVVFSVVGSRSIHLTGNFMVDDEDSCDDCGDSDSSREDIAATDTDDSNEFSDEEDSEDDFTGDADTFPSSPVHNKGVVIEEIVDDDKPTNENGQSKRPKKKKKNQLDVSEENKNSQGQVVAKADPQTEETKKSNVEKTQMKKAKDMEGRATSVKRKVENIDQDGQPESEIRSEEKKKKKKKAQEGEGLPGKEKTVSAVGDKGVSSTKVEKQTEAKSSQSRTLGNGLTIEKLAMGKPNGKIASPGKEVSVHYIGKLQKNGKKFDSSGGKRPFKFRLGAGEVIQGWDIGVNGMRVGDKIRLTIPPSLGYGAKGARPAIPPNAWLVFDVELVDVR